MLETGVSELITIPIDFLGIDAIAWSILGMFEITAGREFGSTMPTPFMAVEGCAGLEDCPEVLESDDFVFDVVCFGGDDVFEFSGEGAVEEL